MLDLELCKKETKILAPRNHKYGKCYFPRIENDSRRVFMGITVGTSFCSMREPLKCSLGSEVEMLSRPDDV